VNPFINILHHNTVLCECKYNYWAISFAYEYPYCVPLQVYWHVMYNVIFFQLDTLLVCYIFWPWWL